MCDRGIPVVGLIAERWNALGGPGSTLGCPLAAEGPVPGEAGIRQMFERGSILWAPERGPRMVVSASQEHNAIVVRWGTTAPDSFDTFRLHMSYNGDAIGPLDCATDDACYRGRPPQCKAGDPCSEGEIRIQHDRIHEVRPASSPATARDATNSASRAARMATAAG